MLVSNKVQKLKDEIQALKVVQPINGGALSRHAATATWEGTIDFNNPISPYSMLAAFVMTYERNDGINKTPLVQFAFSMNYEDTTYEAVVGITSDSVSYKLVLPDNWRPDGYSGDTINLRITGYAYSPVTGDLNIVRVYS